MIRAPALAFLLLAHALPASAETLRESAARACNTASPYYRGICKMLAKEAPESIVRSCFDDWRRTGRRLSLETASPECMNYVVPVLSAMSFN